MQRLFQELGARVEGFLEQRDDVLLLVRCREEDTFLLLKTLQTQDETSPDLFWLFAQDFHAPAPYVESLVADVAQKVDLLSAELVKDGEDAWPPLPPRVIDGRTPPVPRLQALLQFLRTRSKDLDVSRLVTGLVPMRITDAPLWFAFLRELVAHEPRAPWCHHMRIVARDDGAPASAAAIAAIGGPPQGSQWFAMDFSTPALEKALEQEAADESRPLDERLQALLQLAHVDYSHNRLEQAMEKFLVLRTYFAATENLTFLAIVHLGIGEVLLRAKQYDAAQDTLERAMTPAIDGKAHPVLLNISLALGNLHLEKGENAIAAEHYESAAALASALMNAQAKVMALESAGSCRLANGEHEAAQKDWNEALTLARGLKDDPALKRVLLRLRDMYRGAGMGDAVAAIDGELGRLG